MPARVALGVVYHYEFDRANHIYIITFGEVSTYIEPSIPNPHALFRILVIKSPSTVPSIEYPALSL